ncbi:unnamed protein product [Ceratitis capitata]|uniref:(Mediterranean fruit fly) hypothetical protein n=1 Tax=Ceratitis capitata TaxID=7213 RepID=A0A811UP57_CERCA|nr:unnamed protein product [Ceratitis capitata]
MCVHFITTRCAAVVGIRHSFLGTSTICLPFLSTTPSLNMSITMPAVGGNCLLVIAKLHTLFKACNAVARDFHQAKKPKKKREREYFPANYVMKFSINSTNNLS